MCGGGELYVHFTYDTQPPLETRFPLAAGSRYWRELHRCAQCGHYLEYFPLDQAALYGGEYVTATYGDSSGLRKSFERINALPAERSDNVQRVRHIVAFCDGYWSAERWSQRKPALLDVGAGLGVFPYRMRSPPARAASTGRSRTNGTSATRISSVRTATGWSISAITTCTS